MIYQMIYSPALQFNLFSKLKLLIIILCLFFPVLANAHSLSGHVYGNSAALDNVTLELFNSDDALVSSTTSSVDGSYQFSEISQGDYTVTLTPPLVSPFQHHTSGTLSVSDDVIHDFNLISAGYTVSGFVRDAMGRAVSDVAIKVSHTSSQDVLASFQSNADGYYEMALAGGDYNFEIEADSTSRYPGMPSASFYRFSARNITVSADLTLALSYPMYQLSGSVVDHNGEPVSGATISIPSINSNAGEETYSLYELGTLTNEQGEFTLALFEHDNYSIIIKPPADRTDIGLTTFTGFAVSQDNAEQFTLVGSYVVSGFVRDAMGRAVSDVAIKVSHTSSQDVLASFQSNADGYYEMSLASGDYNFEIEADSTSSYPGMPSASFYRFSARDITVSADLTLALSYPMYQLSGSVVDNNGEPISGATISIPSINANVGEETYSLYELGTLTNEQGEFTLALFEHDNYSVIIKPPADRTDIGLTTFTGLAVSQDKTEQFTLVGSHVVSGFVRDAMGRAVSDVAIKVSQTSSQDVLANFQSNADGYYEMSLASGDYNFEITADSTSSYLGMPSASFYRFSARDITVSADLTLALSYPMYQLSGSVVDNNGEPVSGATISIPSINANAGEEHYSLYELGTITNEQGNFTLALFEHDNYSIIIKPPVDRTDISLTTLTDFSVTQDMNQTFSLASNDTTAPVITAPVNVEFAVSSLDGMLAIEAAIAAFLTGATATDNSGETLTVTHNAPSIFPIGVTTVIFSATDSAGNTGTATANVTVNFVDQTAPVVQVPVSIVLSATTDDGLAATHADIVAFLTGATATDNSGETLTVTNNAPSTFPIGVTTVIFSATDSAGNTGTATANVTVNFVDQAAPVVQAPVNIVLSATTDDGLAATHADIVAFLTGATATDNSGETLTVTNNAPSTFSIGVTTVIFSATDSAGNTGTATANVTVNFVDQTAPVVQAPSNIVLSATTDDGLAATHADIVAFLTGATATDNSGETLTVTNNAPSTFSIGVTTVIFSATDSAGNTGTATANVTVNFVDQAAPVVQAPVNIVLSATTDDGLAATHADIVAFLTGATATDNSGETLTVTNNAPSTFPIGVTTVIFSATDSAGNTGTATANVTVNFVDQTAPVVQAPVNIVLSATTDDGLAATHADIAAFLTGATATDNSGETLTVTNNAPSTFPIGVTTVIFSATDSAGNTGTATANVTVNFVDQTAPVVQAPSNIELSATTDDGLVATHADIAAFLTGATATDSSGETLTVTNNAPSTFSIGVTTVIFSATDSVGNTGTATADVTVNFVDQTAPVVQAPSNIELSATTDEGLAATHADIAAFLTGATATDNSGETLTITHNAPSTFPIGVTTVIFSATDSASNTGTATANVTVNFVDEAPYFETIDDIELFANGFNTNILKHINVVAFDDIDGEIAASIVGDHTLLSGRHIVVLSATDSSGNTTFAEVIVYIHPKVSITHAYYVTAGESVNVAIELNGQGARYPITVSFEVEGAGTAETNTVTIDSGRVGSLIIHSNSDATNSDNIKVQLTDIDHGSLANNATSVINIIEANVAPTFIFELTQRGKQTDIIDASGGNATLSIVIDDVNRSDQHSIVWSSAQDIAGLSDAENKNKLSFSATDLLDGTYQVSVTVTELNTDDTFEVTATKQFSVHEQAVELSQTEDSDNDGIVDSEEGTFDTDGDGIADFQDNDDDTSRLPNGNNALIQVPYGITLSVGKLLNSAKRGLADNVLITTADLEQETNHHNASDSSYEHQNDIVNFTITGLPLTGENVMVVLPLGHNKTIPGEAIYRKFHPENGWFNFVEDDNNQIFSAMKDSDGNCPEPNSALFTFALTEGDECIQLLLEDGGANDIDGKVNGIIEDPGVLALDPVNDSPVIVLKETQLVTDELTFVALNAVDSYDPENKTLSFSWSQLSGTAVILASNNLATLEFTTPDITQDETLVFELATSDGVNTSKAQVSVQVRYINQAPDVSISTNNSQVMENTTVVLTAHAEDKDGQSLTYQWTQMSGVNVTLSETKSTALSFTAPEVTSQTSIIMQVTVSDGLIETNSQITLIVNNSQEQVSNTEKPSGGDSGGGSIFHLLLLFVGLLYIKRR